MRFRSYNHLWLQDQHFGLRRITKNGVVCLELRLLLLRELVLLPVLDRQILSCMMVLVKVEIEGRTEKGVGVNFGIVGATTESTCWCTFKF